MNKIINETGGPEIKKYQYSKRNPLKITLKTKPLGDEIQKKLFIKEMRLRKKSLGYILKLIAQLRFIKMVITA